MERELLDKYTREYLESETSVIYEVYGDIGTRVRALYAKVNADREKVGLPSVRGPAEYWMKDEDGEYRVY